MVQSYACVERIWQSPFVIINHKKGNGAGVWMMSCPEEMVLRIWGFWKDISWVFNRWGVRFSFSDLDCQRCIEILKHHKMQHALGWGQHSMVNKELCLSPRVIMDQSQKLINPFVSETKESTCICIYICIIVVIDIIIAIQHIPAFPKSINVKQKVNSLVQDLNSGCLFYFLQWWLLCKSYLLYKENGSSDSTFVIFQ